MMLVIKSSDCPVKQVTFAEHDILRLLQDTAEATLGCRVILININDTELSDVTFESLDDELPA